MCVSDSKLFTAWTPGAYLTFEVQMETPRQSSPSMVRCRWHSFFTEQRGGSALLHYGTYDCSASLGISAEYQSMEHPAATPNRLCGWRSPGTGVRLSDGSSNVIPVGGRMPFLPRGNCASGPSFAGELLLPGVQDLHAAQLASRCIATYSFYREGCFGRALRHEQLRQ
jgi:hypothetical protein